MDPSAAALTARYEGLGTLSVVTLATALGAFSREFPDTTYTLLPLSYCSFDCGVAALCYAGHAVRSRTDPLYWKRDPSFLTNEWLVLFPFGPNSLPLLPLGSHSEAEWFPLAPRLEAAAIVVITPSPCCLGFSLSVSLTGGSLPPNPSGLHSPTVREDRWGAEGFSHSHTLSPACCPRHPCGLAPVPVGVALSTARTSLSPGPQTDSQSSARLP